MFLFYTGYAVSHIVVDKSLYFKPSVIDDDEQAAHILSCFNNHSVTVVPCYLSTCSFKISLSSHCFL